MVLRKQALRTFYSYYILNYINQSLLTMLEMHLSAAFLVEAGG
jgi:hypothetical protein